MLAITVTNLPIVKRWRREAGHRSSKYQARLSFPAFLRALILHLRRKERGRGQCDDRLAGEDPGGLAQAGDRGTEGRRRCLPQLADARGNRPEEQTSEPQ